MRASTRLLFAVLLPVVLLGGSGCTLLGYWAGSEIDESNEEYLALSPDSALTLLETGDKVVCQFDDGSMMTGKYAGMTMPSREQLTEMLHARREADCAGGGTVQIGEELVLHRRERAPEQVLFLGADAQRLWYMTPDGSQARLLLFGHITRLIRCDGTELTPPFEPMVRKGVFDSPRFLRLLQGNTSRNLDTAKIVNMYFLHRPLTGRMALTLLGAVTDGVLLSLATKSEEKKSSPPPVEPEENEDKGSGGTGHVTGCPFIESWDGDTWQPEVEVVAGAFFRAAQRSDVARLHHLRPVNGMLRLRVRDILAEVDSIDRLGLLCVEHMPGTVVYPTEEGRLLAVRPVLPLAAVDRRGHDILPQLGAEDGEAWLALPTADPARRGERQSVECRFPLPAGADSVTLLLRLRNTRWGSKLHGHFLGLYGSGLQAQYDALNASADARACFRAVLEREGLLAVSVWDGAQWCSAGTVREVGHEAWRDVARRIDVSGIADVELRVRLDAPAAIWMVDYVAIDAALPSPVSVTPLPLVSAERNDGSRCASRVRAADGDYVSLVKGEWVAAEFRMPMPPRSGRVQDLFIDFTGYYRPTMAPVSDPQTTLIRRLLEEPGYFARYADGLFWKSITAL